MRFTIAKKLWFGFGTLCALSLGVGLVSLRGASTGAENAQALTECIEDMNAASEAQAALLMARLKVKDFLASNDEKHLADYDKWEADFLAQVKVCKESFQNPERVRLINEIDTKFKTYAETFDHVVAIIKQRNTLLAEQFEPAQHGLNEALSEIEKKAIEANDTALLAAVASALVPVLQSDAEFLEYMRKGESAEWQETVATLDEAQTLLNDACQKFKAHAQSGKLLAACDNFKAYRTHMTSIAALIDQRTTLVTGTLDVLGPEIRKLGTEIDDSLEVTAADREKEVEAAVASTYTMTSAGVGFAVVVGLLAA